MTNELDELCARMRVCTQCRLRETCTQVVPGEGPVDARVMFIGEGPGEDEDREGRPFVGRSGQLLRDTLFQTRVDSVTNSKYFISNTVRCRPPDNRTPNPDECEACWQWTDLLLKLLHPRVLVTLGRPALATLSQKLGFYKQVGQNAITKLAGIPIYLPAHDIYVFPMFHPAYAARRSDARADFYGHSEYLRTALPGWLNRPPADNGNGVGR